MTADYDQGESTREERMAWWHDARFGLFVHWGLYAQPGRGEWIMNRERIPLDEYEKLAETWHPTPGAMRDWCKLAVSAGMEYVVLTTKHHDGFCLWDTAQTDYNAAKTGPARDLIREYVDTCREFGLRVGFYYSLMDWHHADGMVCAKDEAARERFVSFTHSCVRELMSNYGQVDILWYDVSCPLNAEQWQSARLNSMVRELQPDILINNRSRLPEDFGTPEGKVEAAEAGRAWEACLCLNGGPWGFSPHAIDWHTPRSVVKMLHTCASGRGNLLLNVGPRPDGSVQQEAFDILADVGRWLETNGEAVYGDVERTDGRMDWTIMGQWSVKGNNAYFWFHRYVPNEHVIAGFEVGVKRVTLLGGDDLAFRQEGPRLFVSGLPAENPDPIAQTPILRIECDAPPKHRLGAFPVLPT